MDKIQCPVCGEEGIITSGEEGPFVCWLGFSCGRCGYYWASNMGVSLDKEAELWTKFFNEEISKMPEDLKRMILELHPKYKEKPND